MSINTAQTWGEYYKKVEDLKTELCTGCTAFNNIQFSCGLSPINGNLQCPCITCLVKVMCNEDDYSCEIYYRFAKSFR